MKCLFRLTFAALMFALLVPPASAQVSPSTYDYARPGLDWYTIETEHFNIIFHADSSGAGSSRTAQVVARVAEDVYPFITSLYEHQPDTKVSIILKDYEDYSNGASYFFDNKIEIWAPSLNSPLRGAHNWLRNVITHEFTHIVQVQKSMKASRQLPFLYFQYLDYEEVKRPDVLYGYPNVLVTYPIPTLSNPAWLAEGTAQYQRAWLGYDQWDTHRDMLLRTRVLAGEELSLAEMGGFYSHNSLVREEVYNHGYAFTQYLAETYGEDVLRRTSEELSEWDHWNVRYALKAATGQPAESVYGDWMRMLQRQYEARTKDIRAHTVQGELIEKEGFSNFYPRFSPDGKQLAYVSNQGEDFNEMSLYVRDLESGERSAYRVPGLKQNTPRYTCALGHQLKKEGVGGAITWRPDGESIVYARRRDTPKGYLYADLYELDLDTEDTERLTRNQRATAPAYGPEGDRIVFVSQRDGTGNLFVLNTETDEITPLTTHEDGTQISEPAWHPSGDWIYFAQFGAGTEKRDLYRIRPNGSGQEPVLATDADERTPAFAPDGRTLYFSSDHSGIFNLYRRPVGDAQHAASSGHSTSAERLTNVVGGAFMPAVSASGQVAYAQFQWDGYKIALLEEAEPLSGPARTVTYELPPITQKEDAPLPADAERRQLLRYNDTDLRPLEGDALQNVHTEGRFPLSRRGAQGEEASAPEGEQRAVQEYSNKFTSFSFYPVIRLDRYSSSQTRTGEIQQLERSAGEQLLRDTKVGFYASSREVLEGLNLFGGLTVGPASTPASSATDFFSPARLLDMERDVFLRFDYNKGVGLIPRRWSPQFSVELYNTRRNINQGFSLEEIPCTACLPDTSFADISYNLWEVAFFARSKLNRALLLELGYRYSPYSVTTETFFSRELQQSIPASSSRYYIGRSFEANAYFEAMKPHRHGDVMPEGVEAEVGYAYERARLLRSFDLEQGQLVPNYSQYGNHQLMLEARYGVRLPGTLLGGPHGVGLRLKASGIAGGPVDNFFNDYVGGMTGARGYPFYALGGNQTLWLQASYYLPLFPDIGRQVLFTYVDKLYARLYADAAAAWRSTGGRRQRVVGRDVGAELRLKLGSFYLLPTSIFVSGTYGLDTFGLQLDDEFVTPTGQRTVRYGNEWRWHFGALFSFDV